MKTKAIMAAMLIACSVSVANAQSMKVILFDGSIVDYKISEVARVEFVEAEKKEDNPVIDDGRYANGHEYVDLGLPSGTLWATCNIGANSPEEYGCYYSWGEIEERDDYGEQKYKYFVSSEDDKTDTGILKYVPDSKPEYGHHDFTDNKTVLESEDDAAYVIWGGDWRIPTQAEMIELCVNCTWSLTEVKGKKGYKVTGESGKYIFIPAAGCRYDSSLSGANVWGCYWTSSLDERMPDYAWSLCFDFGLCTPDKFTIRFTGLPVRPVRSGELKEN